MKPTLSQFLDTLQPWLSAALLSEPSRQRIHNISAQLPVLSEGCFECWLAPRDTRVDLNACINPRRNEHLLVGDWSKTPAYADTCFDEQWLQVRDFCRRLGEKDFFLQSLVDTLWWMHNIPEPEQSTPFPWCYVSFLKTALDNDPAIKTEMAVKALQYLTKAFSPSDIRAIHRLLYQMPPNFRTQAIGLKNTPEGHFFRLYLDINSLDDLHNYLEQEHWPGGLQALKSTLAPWTTPAYSLRLSLDFNKTLQPKIGVECYFFPEQLQRDLAFYTDRLVDAGLCSAAKREALLKWNGAYELETAPAFWAAPSGTPAAASHQPLHVQIKRMISAIKMVYEPEKPLRAKVYLRFQKQD